MRQAAKGVGQVLAFQVLAMLLNALQLHLAQRFWEGVGLSYFTQWRKFCTLVVPLALLGHGISLARELGRAYDSSQRRADIVASSFLLVSSVLLIVGAAAVCLPRLTAQLVMGSPELRAISGALGLGICAQGLATLMATYWRGRFRFLWSVVLGTVVLGVVPVCGLFAFRHRSPSLGIWVVAAGQLAVAAVPVLLGVARFWRSGNRLSLRALGRESWVLTRYGLARLPVLGLSAAFMGFGSWQLARSMAFGELGLYNSLAALANATNIASSALAFTMLPVFSALFKDGNSPGASRALSALVQGALTVSLFLALQLFLFGPGVASLIIGRAFDTADVVWGGIFLTIAGMFLTNIIRDPLDAYSAVPYVLISFVAGAAAMGASWWLCTRMGRGPLEAVVIATVLGSVAMGATAMVLALAIFRVTVVRNVRTVLGLLVAALLAAAGYAERRFGPASGYLYALWLVVNSVVFGLALLWLRVPWLTQFLQRLRRRSSSPGQPAQT